MMRSALFLIAVLAACDAYDRDLGPAPFLCGASEPRCPMGYECMMDGISGDEICVGEGGSVTDEFDCADDSAYEPNDTLAAATETTLPAFTLDGLAVCPANDKDAFKIVLAAQANVEVLITFDPNSTALKAELLNQGGVPIATGSGVAGMPGTVRAAQQNLPVGMYFGVVSGPNDGTAAVNNFKLTINAN